MPTVLRQDGFRVVIYPNDHLPSHVHVLKGSGEIRIDLGNEDIAPRLMSVLGNIRDKDVVQCIWSKSIRQNF